MVRSDGTTIFQLIKQMDRRGSEITPELDIEQGNVQQTNSCSSIFFKKKKNSGSSIKDIDGETPESPMQKAEVCMYRVPQRLLEVNEKAYEPNVISIGPYHRGKEHLTGMEAVKKRYFQKILEESNLSVLDFEKAIAPFEAIRQCYEDSGYTGFISEEMMILDGCFIIQLIREVYPEDDIFKFGRIQTDIHVDLLLLENQLPFFVLFKLYGVIVPNAGVDIALFARMALKSLFNISFDCPLKNDIKHLLDLVHSCHLPSPQGIQQHQDFKAKAAAGARKAKPKRLWNFIRCATELEDAGIKFEKTENQRQGIDYSFDIMFPKGTNVLRIPTLTVNDSTERTLRNYMAYEQFVSSGEPTYFCNYVVFMDNLIDTAKDVQLLCNNRIIDNWLGDDKAVAKMINRLGDSICYSQEFYYAEIYRRVNKHCHRKMNKWMAALKRDYFHNPWSITSFFAAVVLLLLTLLQTIISVLSYYKQ